MKLRETPTFDARTVTDKRLIEIISEESSKEFDQDEMLEALKLLRKDSATTVPMMKKLVSTGTPQARRLAASIVRRNCLFVTEARKWEDRDPDWRNRVELVWYPNGAPQVLHYWVMGNILDETGSISGIVGIIDTAMLISGVDNAAHGVTTSGYPSALQKGTETYWRGLSALFLSKVVYRADKELRARAQAKARYDFYAHVDDFVEWAGNHEDINTVIDTARRHKTIVVADLKDLISQSEGAKSMSTGVI